MVKVWSNLTRVLGVNLGTVSISGRTVPRIDIPGPEPKIASRRIQRSRTSNEGVIKIRKIEILIKIRKIEIFIKIPKKKKTSRHIHQDTED